MKGYKKIILNAASLITTEHAIPAKAGIQENTGFRVRPGMTDPLRFISPCIVAVLTLILISIGITLTDQISANGQSREKRSLIEDSKRDPFLLPSGVHLLSKIDKPSGEKRILSKADAKPNDTLPSFKVKAILISDHVRLALIDHHIATIGDSVRDEKVLEIKTDRVVLGKGDQKRTLLLSQSPVLLTVEERPSALTLPRKGGGKEGNKGE